MAGTVTKAENSLGSPQKAVFAWTASVGGAADAVSDHAYHGTLIRVHIVPGTGADTPDDLFTVTLTDSHGVDLLYGQGANCSNVNTTVIENVGAISNDNLTLAVTNAGAANTGTVIVIIA